MLRARWLAVALSVLGSVGTAETDEFPPIMTEDPAGFVLRMDLPHGVRMLPDSVAFVVVATHSPSGETWRRSYPTVPVPENEGLPKYRIDEIAFDDLRDLQAQLRAAVATSDGNSRLQLGITGQACRTGDLGPSETSLFLHLSDEEPPLILAQDIPLHTLLQIDPFMILPMCDS